MAGGQDPARRRGAVVLTDLDIAPAAPGERRLLAQLLQLYLHDFSEFAPIDTPHGEVQADGRFPFANIDSFFRLPEREALLFRYRDRPAGFALIHAWSALGQPVDRAIAEFCVLRKYRRAGVGRAAAAGVLARHRGTWEVAVAAYNAPAQAFWATVLPALPGWQAAAHPCDTPDWTGPVWRLAPV